MRRTTMLAADGEGGSGAVAPVPGIHVGQAFLLFGISLLLVVSVGFAVQAIYPRGGLAFTELGLILLPALWFVRRKAVPVARALRITPIRVSTALLAIVLGVAGWGVAMLIHGAIVAMLAGSVFLLMVKAGPWSLDGGSETKKRV